ncbi:MAG: putative deoxyribonuclease YcfH [Candidatus Heimdallarchaeota archaeon LC_2]|nr:MAG: putative deoxyribonuclease YcfH [Candidatus Heimdallarchaeota archaeon LC_2]
MGLDYHWVKDQAKQKKQKDLFLKCIEMSNEYKLPIVIHSRKAESDCLDILEKYSTTKVLLHSFEGNKELVIRSNDLGYLISIPTNVVIRKSRRKVAKRAGLENIVIETDSPYCAPSEDLFPNTPASIPIAGQKLANILDCELSELMKTTTDNAERFYEI